MGNIYATINQLRTPYGDGFLNVNNNESGQLSVWGSSFRQPTYLMVDGCRFCLVTFADREFAAEELKKTATSFIKVWRIEEFGLVKIK